MIQNPVISKTQKVRIFTEENMKHLGNLYHWKGIQEWRKYDKYDKHDKQDDTMEVRVTVRNSQFLSNYYLQVLFCDFFFLQERGY